MGDQLLADALDGLSEAVDLIGDAVERDELRVDFTDGALGGIDIGGHVLGLAADLIDFDERTGLVFA